MVSIFIFNNVAKDLYLSHSYIYFQNFAIVYFSPSSSFLNVQFEMMKTIKSIHEFTFLH